MGRRKDVHVVAALIWHKDTFLICQRPADKVRGLLWEFVGGKMEPGENKQQTLIRECAEELGVTVQPLDVYMQLKHVYPEMTIKLTLFNAIIVEGIPQKFEHNDLKWITVPQIDDYEFCPADEQVLARIKQEYADKHASIN